VATFETTTSNPDEIKKFSIPLIRENLLQMEDMFNRVLNGTANPTRFRDVFKMQVEDASAHACVLQAGLGNLQQAKQERLSKPRSKKTKGFARTMTGEQLEEEERLEEEKTRQKAEDDARAIEKKRLAAAKKKEDEEKKAYNKLERERKAERARAAAQKKIDAECKAEEAKRKAAEKEEEAERKTTEAAEKKAAKEAEKERERQAKEDSKAAEAQLRNELGIQTPKKPRQSAQKK
jgi:hypothetical protein